jgi:ubiquinone/menaquinone biosynthesis C-methylase UbiE
MQPINDVGDISRIAYGFMASKALFAALDINLFARLSGAEKSLDDLMNETGVAENQLGALLAALTALGLIERESDRFRNAPASERYLVPGAPDDSTDYYRYQINQQVYPAMLDLERVFRGESVAGPYDIVSDDVSFAENFSRGRHTGSLGPAYLLSRDLALDGRRSLLDVGGGSGAFSIMLCRRFPELKSTILDFPNVLKVAERYVDEAGFSQRIALRPGNAISADWPGGQDVVLFSYICSAISEADIDIFIAKAYGSLKPGGLLIIHDFMIDDEGAGPMLAAQWNLVTLMGNPRAISLTPSYLSGLARDAGFTSIETRELIPDITSLAICEKS